MARGRMLNRSVSFSIKFNRLPDDSCRLLATWLIPHLDYRGVFYADADLVKGQVMPMRADLTLEHIERYLLDMQRAGLLVLFYFDERRWMFWPGFAHNQTLRAGKEKSDFPLPPADGQPRDMTIKNDSPSTGGPRADNGPSTGDPRTEIERIREEKRREEKRNSAAKPARDSSSEHNMPTSSDAEPTDETPTSPTQISQTDKLRAGTFADLIYERAMKVKGNPALAQILKWKLAERIETVCVDYVEIAKGTPVVEADKGKWAKGAKDVLELFRQNGRAYSRTWMEQAIKQATFTHTHPMALDTAFRELFKKNWTPAGTPANDGTVHVGWVQNERGEMVEQVKKVVTHA